MTSAEERASAGSEWQQAGRGRLDRKPPFMRGREKGVSERCHEKGVRNQFCHEKGVSQKRCHKPICMTAADYITVLAPISPGLVGLIRSY
jgi:hypothetical protein